MIERREHLRFALEARQAIGIAGERRRQHLDRDVAIQLRIARAIDLAHAAGAEQADNAIEPEGGAGREATVGLVRVCDDVPWRPIQHHRASVGLVEQRFDFVAERRIIAAQRRHRSRTLVRARSNTAA